jgi:hypothetical protein
MWHEVSTPVDWSADSTRPPGPRSPAIAGAGASSKSKNDEDAPRDDLASGCRGGLPRSRLAQDWACRAALAVLPVLLAWVAYYRPVLRGEPVPRIRADATFYAYQLARAGEVRGRWWEVADDELVGAPYQPETSKHPGIYEGVDLLLISAAVGRSLDPTQTYHLAVIVVLAINGWVAGWIVRHLTRSYLWAALAIVLITLNYPTSGRMMGHLHLFKHGWVILAVWAFWRYLDVPSLRRGVAFGLLMAWVLQGSFYFGFLLALGLGIWWVGCGVAGRLGWEHLAATCAAGASVALAGAAATFPVWTVASKKLLTEEYFQRSWFEVWAYGSDLWQYVVPPDSPLAAGYFRSTQIVPWLKKPEGWNFPGYTVLLAVAIYLVARLRGHRACDAPRKFLDVVMGLMAIFAVLSLSGGPSYLFFLYFPSFRCYGRAGLLSLGLGCVAAPIVFQGAIARVRSRMARLVLIAGVLALAYADARRVADHFRWLPGDPDPPAWVEWLSRQPPGIRLAAFSPPHPNVLYWWGIPGDAYRLRHGHATLNGCDFQLLQGDLKLLGASYERMTPSGLRFVVSLGYRTLAFRRDYLDANPWIRDAPWLERVAERGEWLVLRARSEMLPFPGATMSTLVALRAPAEDTPRVPARSWITGQLETDRDVVTSRNAPMLLVWADARGEYLGKPNPGLSQHIFGPGMPAYTVKTPKTPGSYRLAFLDPRGRLLGSRPYLITSELSGSHPGLDGRGVDVAVNAATVDFADSSKAVLRVALENASHHYLQVHTDRGTLPASGRAQPGLFPAAPGSLSLQVRVVHPAGRSPPQEFDVLPPRDLSPGGRLEWELPLDRLVGEPGAVRVEVMPKLAQMPPRVVSPEKADLRLVARSVPGDSAQVAHGEDADDPGSQSSPPIGKSRFDFEGSRLRTVSAIPGDSP